MFTQLLSSLVLGAALCSALPIHYRDVTIDQAAAAAAHVRDNTATRAFSSQEIKTSDGQCLFIDPASGSARENNIPIQTATCDGSEAQKWDVITAGVHNNQPGFALIVNNLVQGCLDFNPAKAAAINLFACGGRADGSGKVTSSQLFTFAAGTGATPFPLVPQSGKKAVCVTVSGDKLVNTACDPATASGAELFTIG